jgi:hypothetical protein
MLSEGRALGIKPKRGAPSRAKGRPHGHRGKPRQQSRGGSRKRR